LKRKVRPTVSPEGTWFPSGPLFSSLLLHGFLAYFLMTWTFSHAPESVTRVVMVQIVEEKQEKPPVPPTPIRPKPKKVQEIIHPKPALQPVVSRKEEEAPSPVVYQAAEQKVPEVLQVHEEKVGVEEKPKEKWMEKAEPGRWGAPEGPQDAEPVRLGKEEPPMSLTADSGSTPKGIPGGFALLNPSGKGVGGDAGFAGGVEGGNGKVPPRGATTGSIYFQGEGKGRGDLGSYLGNARMRIEKAKRYPREARRRGWEGKVVLSFQINRKGEVAQIRLVQSSGYQELDEEGIATLRRASPFSPPPWADEEKLEVQIPLVFRLDEGR
jgi:TonB family protein